MVTFTKMKGAASLIEGKGDFCYRNQMVDWNVHCINFELKCK